MIKQLSVFLAFVLFATSVVSAEKDVAPTSTLAQAATVNSPPPAGAPSTIETMAASALPNKLEGHWTMEPRRQFGNTWSIRRVGDKWLMTWWRVKDVGCSIEDAPVTVNSDTTGGLVISLDSSYECMLEFHAKLERNGAEFKGAGEGKTAKGGGKFSVTLR